jgi:hypothetical protein
MSRATVILDSKARREQAARWCLNAPRGTRVTFAEAKRSTDQNAFMWAALTDIAVQVDWHGVKLSADDWKLIFMAALNQEMRLVPNLDGNGFVNLGRSSSNLSKAEMADLLELILKFGAERGVQFHDGDQGAGGAKNPAREVAA